MSVVRPRRRTARLALVALIGSLLAVPAVLAAQADTVVPDPFFGTWSDGMSPTRADAAAAMDQQAGAGLGTMRQYVFWDRIETRQGSYDWTVTDRLVEDASARGMTVLPTLLYTPAFYVAKPTAKGLQPPDDPTVMGAFAKAMVQRYGPQGEFWRCTSRLLDSSCRQPYAPIKAWEVWNEPDHPGWWKGKPDVNEYLALLKAVSTSIRQADPRAEVVLGAMLSTEGSKPGGYLDRLYGLGGGPFFDTLSLNPYAHDVGGMVTFLAGQRAIAAKHGDADKPMRVTEYGWATSGRSASYVTSEGCQGALLHAATTRLRQVSEKYRIKSAIQFQWRDARQNDPNELWPHYAGLLRHDGTSKPAVTAVAAAIAGKPAPDGLELQQACPQNRQTLDGTRITTVGGGAVTSTPAGISCGTDCVEDFPYGTNVILTATPAPGERFVGWTGEACGSGTSPTCSYTALNAGRTATAVFTSEQGASCPTPSSSAVSSPTPSSTPSASRTPSPTSTVTPTEQATPTDEPTPTEEATPSDGPTSPAAGGELVQDVLDSLPLGQSRLAVSSDDPTPADEPTPTDDPTPTGDPTPTDDPTPTGAPTPTDDPTPVDSPSTSPSASSSSPSSSSPSPSRTPATCTSGSPAPTGSPSSSSSPPPGGGSSSSPSPTTGTGGSGSGGSGSGGSGSGGSGSGGSGTGGSTGVAGSPAPSPSGSPTASTAAGSSPASPTSSASPRALAGSGYVALTSPVRVLDSRSGLGTTRALKRGPVVLDLSGSVPADATAAALNVTVTGPTGAGFLVVHPASSSRPGTSNVNFVRGQTQANEVVVQLPPSKKVVLDLSAPAHVVVDLVGSFTRRADAPGLGRFVTQEPRRVLDSRSGLGTPKGAKRGEVVLDLRGAVPSDATSVVLNVTLTGADAPGHLVAYPAGVARPRTSNVNVDRGQTQANEVITRLGTGAQAGRVSLFLQGTRAQVVVDLVSVVVPTRRSGTQLLTALTDPKRVLDSRKGVGTSTGRKSGAVVLTLPAGLVPSGATGVVLNVTTTGANRVGHVTVHRAGSRDPGTSNVNFRSGTNQANQVLTGIDGQRRVTLRVGGGTQTQTHLVVDVAAYLTGG